MYSFKKIPRGQYSKDLVVWAILTKSKGKKFNPLRKNKKNYRKFVIARKNYENVNFVNINFL